MENPQLYKAIYTRQTGEYIEEVDRIFAASDYFKAREIAESLAGRPTKGLASFTLHGVFHLAPIKDLVESGRIV